ncbi:SDR family NAD(P)-dependent oxidoreductase [Halobacillus mangrovi]|uniref:SDR family NAD(P)-dependent oxidoreductase n=1 Tax=Halobacillus mangrovi TaxID=402384 RepID=UPI003D9620A1
METLKNEVVIITGSTRGIGKSIALYLAASGAAVIINGRDAEAVHHVVEEVRSYGGKATGVPGSVTEEKTGEKLVDSAIKEYGKVTGLINNAGNVNDKISYRMSFDEFKEVIDVHINGAFSSTLPFIRNIRERKPKQQSVIINMSSSSGLTGNIGQVNYSTAKAGLIGLTRTLAKEMNKYRVSVYAVAPAALTDMTRPYIEMAQKQASSQGKDLPDYWKVGSAEQVAEYIAEMFYAPDQFESGEVYAVNGEQRSYWTPSEQRFFDSHSKD